MAVDIDALRKEKERLAKEQEAIERRLEEAERQERAKAAQTMLEELFELSDRIDALKTERQALLLRIRDAAPRLGDFSYASDDWRLCPASTLETFKQAPLLERFFEQVHARGFRIDPRSPRFRIVRGLTPVGTLNVAARRFAVAVLEPILDPVLLADVEALNERFPGLAAIEWASAKRGRRVREGAPFERRDDGDYALSITFSLSDTGSYDAVEPLLFSLWEQVVEWWARWTPETDARIFEPLPVTPVVETPIPETPVAEESAAAAQESAEG